MGLGVGWWMPPFGARPSPSPGLWLATASCCVSFLRRRGPAPCPLLHPPGARPTPRAIGDWRAQSARCDGSRARQSPVPRACGRPPGSSRAQLRVLLLRSTTSSSTPRPHRTPRCRSCSATRAHATPHLRAPDPWCSHLTHAGLALGVRRPCCVSSGLARRLLSPGFFPPAYVILSAPSHVPWETRRGCVLARR